MKSLVNKILIGAAGLVLAAAPLAASADTWHGHDSDRGGYHRDDGRGYDRDRDRDRFERRDRDDRVRFERERPVYRGPFVNGYFGWAPGGFQGYYWNGNWYHHRRWNGGVWIYF
jgi:hypothetical protein